MDAEYDYIVVGSGAGGGPLAARLAMDPAGYRVALLEAGIDPAGKPRDATWYNYSVPVFYPKASEDPEISWDFEVQHYENVAQQKKDTKWKDGIFYPRAAALGGCTAHHA